MLARTTSTPAVSVLGAHRVTQRERDLAEQIVAGSVAESVVEPLEAVEVDHHQRKRPAHPCMSGDLVLGAHQQRAPVRDAGQRIAEREVV